MQNWAFDKIQLDPSKIIQDDEDELVVRTVLASEIVHQYPDGWAYKPAEELQKTAWTLDGRWIRLFQHPAEKTIQRAADVSGQIRRPKFTKSLRDPKTGRPMRRGIIGDIHFFKHDRGRPGCTPTPEAVLAKIRSGDLHDVSIGFTYNKDVTPGAHNGTHYDYVQRNIFHDHIAAPVEVGRCPAPYCGFGLDQQMIFIGLDPWEETEEYIRSGHKNAEGYDQDSLRTIDISEGIKAVVGCPKGKFTAGKCQEGMEILSYLFAKSSFTMEEAKAWFESHKGDQNMSYEEFMEECLKGEGMTEETCKEKWAAQQTDQNTEYQTFIEKCLQEEGMDMEKCVAKWKEQHGEDSCPLCELLIRLGHDAFIGRMFRVYGRDVLKMFDQEGEPAEKSEREKFMEQCLAEEGMTQEECEIRWKAKQAEQEPESTDQLVIRVDTALKIREILFK